MNSRLNIWIILLILCFLALGYVSFKQYKTQNELKINQEKLSQLESSYSMAYLKFTSVLPNEIEEYVKKNDSVIVYFGRPDCIDCNFFESNLLKKVDEYGISNKLVYVNVSPIHKNKKEWEEYKLFFGIEGTPSFVFYKNGIQSSSLDYERDSGLTTRTFENWLQKNNLLE